MTLSPGVSVVVPTYQRRECLRSLLTALQCQSVPPETFEVIVSVDGSTDGTLEMVRAFDGGYPLRAIWNPNGGRASACNAGVREARGRIIVLLDDDMEPQPGLLAAHMAAHEQADRVGAMGAVPIPAGTDLTLVQRYIARKFNHHLDVLSHAGHRLDLRDFYSGNFSVERAVLVEIGGFDESFKMYGNEDLELSLRLRQAGVTLCYCPEALAYQRYTKNFRSLVQDTMAKGMTSLLLASKWPDVLPQLRLATHDLASWRWRLVRAFLVQVGLRVPSLRTPLSVLADALAHLWPSRADAVYGLTLDYFFWLGVELGERQQRESSPDAPWPERVS